MANPAKLNLTLQMTLRQFDELFPDDNAARRMSLRGAGRMAFGAPAAAMTMFGRCAPAPSIGSAISAAPATTAFPC
jgi:hypothetical protein